MGIAVLNEQGAGLVFMLAKANTNRRCDTITDTGNDLRLLDRAPYAVLTVQCFYFFTIMCQCSLFLRGLWLAWITLAVRQVGQGLVRLGH